MGVILPLDCGVGSGSERRSSVCVPDRPKDRERERRKKEFLSQDEEKEGKSWTTKRGKGHRVKGRRAKKRAG